MTLNLFYNDDKIEAGVDEVGRGSLIGRVYAAAVIWPNDPEILEELGPHLQIKDSKKVEIMEVYDVKWGEGKKNKCVTCGQYYKFTGSEFCSKNCYENYFIPKFD